MKTAIVVEGWKMTRRGLWWLVFIGPFGVLLLQYLNFTIRYDWLIQQHKDDLWGGWLSNVGFLGIPAVLLGVALVASQLAQVEHQTGMWSLLCALPVSKRNLYFAKWIWTLVLILISTVLLSVGSIGVGALLDFPLDELSLQDVLLYTVIPTLLAIPALSLQVWLSTVRTQQVLPLAIGIFGILVSQMMIEGITELLPWRWPVSYMVNQENELFLWALAGAMLFFVVGMGHFRRKEVALS